MGFEHLNKASVIRHMQSQFVETFDDFIEKGRGAQIGEIRDWKGGKYQKTTSGWVPYRSHTAFKGAESEKSKAKKAKDFEEHEKWPKFEGTTGPEEFGSPQFEDDINLNAPNDKVYMEDTGKKDDKGRPIFAWSKERMEKVHKPIVDSYVKRGKKNPDGQKTVTLMMGAPASGKGTIQRLLTSTGEMSKDIVAVDPDEIKTKGLQPDYARFFDKDKQSAASRVHEEGSDIAKEVFSAMEDNGFDYLQDKVFADYDKLIKEINRLDKKGYKVKIVMAKLPIEEGLVRMKQRGERSGRFVPEDYMKEQYAKIDETWNKLKETMPSNVLSAVQYNTSNGAVKSDEWTPAKN